LDWKQIWLLSLLSTEAYCERPPQFPTPGRVDDERRNYDNRCLNTAFVSFAAAPDREMYYLHEVRVCGREMRSGWENLPQKLFQVQPMQDAAQVSNSGQESIIGTIFKKLGAFRVNKFYNNDAFREMCLQRNYCPNKLLHNILGCNVGPF